MREVFLLQLLMALTFANPSALDETPDGFEARQVQINGRVAAAEALTYLESSYRVQIPTGSYWYDPASGLWGNWGAPPSGQIVPGLELGKLPAHASGGATGVVINGRVLHQREVDWLVSVFGQANPGRYWLDAYGNIGLEGQPLPLANLLAASRARQGGGFYHSDSTGATVSSSGGSGYIMFEDGSGVSW